MILVSWRFHFENVHVAAFVISLEGRETPLSGFFGFSQKRLNPMIKMVSGLLAVDVVVADLST